MLKQLLLTALTVLLCNTALAGVVTNPLYTKADFWTSRLPKGEEVIMTPAQIKLFNQKVNQVLPAKTFDLAALPARVDSSVFKKNLTDYSALNGTVYKGGVKVEQDYKDRLIDQVNAGQLPEQVEVRYAVVTKHSNLRSLPTEDGLFDNPEDTCYDDLQNTTLEVGEPVAVFAASKDGDFYFVEMHNYQGWIARENLAFCTREQWLKYLEPERFLMVIDPDYNLPLSGRTLYYQMSARIPYQSQTPTGYVVTVPTRTGQGDLKNISVSVPKAKALHEGYLPYTQNNIIRQAFKYYGHVYGWGGLRCSVDCSGLSYDLFRTMGLYLPRNAGDQALTAGLGTNVQGFTRQQRLAALATLEPGSTIHLRRSHMMLYLGQVNGIPYIIHSSGGYYKDGKRIEVQKVIVSDLELEKKMQDNFYPFLMLSDKYMTFKL